MTKKKKNYRPPKDILWNYGLQPAETREARFKLLMDVIRKKRLKSICDALRWTEITSKIFYREFPEASKERIQIENLIKDNIQFN